MKKIITIKRAQGESRSFENTYDAAEWVFGKMISPKFNSKSQLYWEKALVNWSSANTGCECDIAELRPVEEFKTSNKALLFEAAWIKDNGY